MRQQAHSVLGIPASATVAQARAAFRRLALMHHPDRNPGDPRAHERFKKILRAYRTAMRSIGRARAAGASSHEVPAGPRPDRYACGRCGDSFPFPESCPRCGVRLCDRAAGPPVDREDARVRALIEELESRPAPPEEPGPEPPVPAMLVGACLAAGAVVWQVGPVGVALLFVGFAAYVTGLELHRRASLTP
ncbi:MAG TPA: J domain-containing protein [Sandaracinaceae bacterium LLY-WYZ-13_1]|nr:J domain-containing protein [Sandaracinaceae bacterium LLY-WYZ-13_1]